MLDRARIWFVDLFFSRFLGRNAQQETLFREMEKRYRVVTAAQVFFNQTREFLDRVSTTRSERKFTSKEKKELRQAVIKASDQAERLKAEVERELVVMNSIEGWPHVKDQLRREQSSLDQLLYEMAKQIELFQ